MNQRLLTGGGKRPGELWPTFVLMAVAVLIVVAGCGTAPSTGTPASDSGTFRGRWWHYYERALSQADSGRLTEAKADLQQALGQRDQDQRMARTYGMHFIDYFPHRELGVVLLQAGDLEEAQRELELSLRQYPSAKASFYLDKVRKALITRQAVTVAPPRLSLDAAQTPIWTAADPVVISGEAVDSHFVAGVTVNGKPVFMEGALQQIRFSENLALADGRHEVAVEAVNLMGKTTVTPLVIHVDRQGPVFTVDQIKAGPKGAAVLSGWIVDDAGVVAASLDDQPLPIQAGTEVRVEQTVAAGKGEIRLTCKDRLGNRTEAQIAIAPRTLSQRSRLIAALESDLLISQLFGPKDEQAPVIDITDWSDAQTVFIEKLPLNGRVSDDGQVVGLTLNGRSILRHKGQQVAFNQQIALKEGANTIVVEAKDASGKTTTRKITVTRQIPAAFELKERLAMTVLPFDQKGQITPASTPFQDNLAGALVNRNRFNMVERAKLDAVLNEQKIALSKLVDQETAVKAGRLVAAGAVVAGTIVESANGIEVAARVVDTETSVILAAVDTYDEVKGLGQAGTLAEGLALKIHRAFPLVDGIVVQQKGPAIFINLGKDKAELNRRFIVFREEVVKDDKGQVFGSDNVVLGRARVTQVNPNMSKAELVGCKPEDVKSKDKVVTE